MDEQCLRWRHSDTSPGVCLTSPVTSLNVVSWWSSLTIQGAAGSSTGTTVLKSKAVAVLPAPATLGLGLSLEIKPQ